MELGPESKALSLWLIQYGSFALFTLLALEIIALPIPGELLMLVAGVLMNNGDLFPISTFIAGYAGAILGIHVSYVLGYTAGHHLLLKYGKYVWITEKRIEKAHDWFTRFGKWTIVLGFYIPGVRHLTGFFAGASYLEYKTFAPYAIFGAIVWVTLFLCMGYFGNHYLTSFLTFIGHN
jgi:membrane protein DedA with SNARE-associated domain